MDPVPTSLARTADLAKREATELQRAYELHGATVYRFCCQTLPRHLAEEATQEVFIQAWKHRDRFDAGRGSVIAWLIGIAKLRVIDLARHEKRHSDRRTDLGDDDNAGLSHRSDDDIDRLATKAVISDALRNLPERQRRSVTMAFIDGLTQQEIAERTQTALGTVKSDIRRGLLTIREHVEGAGV